MCVLGSGACENNRTVSGFVLCRTYVRYTKISVILFMFYCVEPEPLVVRLSELILMEYSVVRRMDILQQML